MSLRGEIERLRALPDSELQGAAARQLEDIVQRGLSAIHTGELWMTELRRALEGSFDRPSRAVAIATELAAARTSVESVRGPVLELMRRAQRLGVGTPAAIYATAARRAGPRVSGVRRA